VSLDRRERSLPVRSEPIRLVEDLRVVAVAQDHPPPHRMTLRPRRPPKLRREERLAPSLRDIRDVPSARIRRITKDRAEGASMRSSRVRSIGPSAVWGAVNAHARINPRLSPRHSLTTWSLRNCRTERLRPKRNDRHSPRACSPSPVESAATARTPPPVVRSFF